MCIMSKVDMLKISQHTDSIVLLIEKNQRIRVQENNPSRHRNKNITI